VEVIEKLAQPTSIKGVRSSLGYIGFYQRFFKDFLKIAKSLTHLLVKDVPFDFNDECFSAFFRLKEPLISTPVMQALNWGLLFEVMCDATDFALGSILGQRRDNKPYAIYYATHTLDEAQVNYVITEKEFLAVVFAFEKFLAVLLNKFQSYFFHRPCHFEALIKKFDAKSQLSNGFLSSKSLTWRSRQGQVRECGSRSLIPPRPRSHTK